MLPLHETYESFRRLVEGAESILCVTRAHPTEDSLGSLLALGLALEKLGKEVTLVAHGPLASSLSFLPGFSRIVPTTDARGQFVIALDTTSAKVADLSYDFSDDGKELRICVTPQDGMFDARHVRCDIRRGAFDLVITVDAPDFESLGPAYEQARDLFVSVPVANIAAHAGNARYGEVNVVDETATSTAEVLVPLLESFGGDVMDANVATALLAGIIAGTRSFQRETTSPRAFTIAAQLVAHGADQQRVVRSLFKNRSLAGMRLWGRLFSHLSYDEPAKIAWASASRADFVEVGAEPADLAGIEDELAMSLPGVSRAVIFFEDADGAAHARLTCFDGEILAVSRAFGTPARGLCVEVVQPGVSLAETQEAVLNTLKTIPTANVPAPPLSSMV